MGSLPSPAECTACRCQEEDADFSVWPADPESAVCRPDVVNCFTREDTQDEFMRETTQDSEDMGSKTRNPHTTDTFDKLAQMRAQISAKYLGERPQSSRKSLPARLHQQPGSQSGSVNMPRALAGGHHAPPMPPPSWASGVQPSWASSSASSNADVDEWQGGSSSTASSGRGKKPTFEAADARQVHQEKLRQQIAMLRKAEAQADARRRQSAAQLLDDRCSGVQVPLSPSRATDSDYSPQKQRSASSSPTRAHERAHSPAKSPRDDYDWSSGLLQNMSMCAGGAEEADAQHVVWVPRQVEAPRKNEVLVATAVATSHQSASGWWEPALQTVMEAAEVESGQPDQFTPSRHLPTATSDIVHMKAKISQAMAKLSNAPDMGNVNHGGPQDYFTREDSPPTQVDCGAHPPPARGGPAWEAAQREVAWETARMQVTQALAKTATSAGRDSAPAVAGAPSLEARNTEQFKSHVVQLLQQQQEFKGNMKMR